MTPKVNSTKFNLQNKFMPYMAASQAKPSFISQMNTNNSHTTANNLSQLSIDPTMVVGPSLNKITRNQLTMARMRSFERPNAATSGEEAII